MTLQTVTPPIVRHAPGSTPAPTRVFIDLTHLGRHVTGIERVSIEQFETVTFADANVTHVRANGLLSLIFRQQIWLPLLALFHPRAMFVFPGFPPSPLFILIPGRVILYVHDLFLITRRGDLGTRAKLYMAWPFSLAVRRLRAFQVNSLTTGAELAAFARPDAQISLYRPTVRNVFALEAGDRAQRPANARPLRLVTLGTVEPRKNYSAALPILDALAALGHTDCELHIIGREGWGEAKAALNGDTRVTIHGYLSAERVKAVLQSADIYLCTSHDEGLGLPLLEAQYAGLAVVAPDKPVFREVLGASAQFIDVADPVRAADTIAAVISAPDWRARCSQDSLANVLRWNQLAAHDRLTTLQMFAQNRSGARAFE